MAPTHPFLPAVILSEHETAFDALVALDVPRNEAMDLVVAGWPASAAPLLTSIDGGRCVAAVRLASGRWAACNAYPEAAAVTPAEAERRLTRLAGRRKRGLVIRLEATVAP